MNQLQITGKISFNIPSRLFVGEVAITKNEKGIGQLAVVVRTNNVNDISDFAFLDQSKSGKKSAQHFITCSIISEGGGMFLVRLTDENLIKLIEAFENKTVMTGGLTIRQDLATFDTYYCVEIE